MKRRLFDKPTDWAILAFIVGAFFMMAKCEASFAIEEQHDSNAGTTEFNGGLDRICGRYFFNTGTSMYLCPLMAVSGHIKGDSLEIGITEPWRRMEAEVRLNRFNGEMDGGFSIRRRIGDGKFNLLLGGSYWINESPGSNSTFTFNLGLRYRF